MISFSPKQELTITRPFDHTFEIEEGTPRSGKTTAGAFRDAAYFIAESEDENHLALAYNQTQAYRMLIDGDGMGLMHIFNGNCEIKHDEHGDHLLMYTPKGQKRLYYKGANHKHSHHSFVGMSLGSVRFLEIDLLHTNAIEESFKRTYAAKHRWHRGELNPPAPFHPVLNIFDEHDAHWQHWTMQDNPVMTKERLAELEKQLKKSPYLYARDWLGERVIPTGVIYAMFDQNKHIVDEKQIKGDMVDMFFTGDGGQSDATSMSCNIVTREGKTFRMYRVAHYYHSGKETGQIKAMSTYAQELDGFMRWCADKYNRRPSVIMIDPACKALREELHKINWPTSPALNNGKEHVGAARGIEVGIERCQNVLTDGVFYLVHNDKWDHYNFLKEIGLYCRQDNGTPVDADNHALDEWRYSVNYFTRMYPQTRQRNDAN